jgi:hypothetical protein
VSRDADGHFVFDQQQLPFPGNQPRPVTVTANPPDFRAYWPGSATGSIVANQTSILDVDLVPVCTGVTISGSVVNAVTLQPIAGASIDVMGVDGAIVSSTLTDVSGGFCPA